MPTSPYVRTLKPERARVFVNARGGVCAPVRSSLTFQHYVGSPKTTRATSRGGARLPALSLDAIVSGDG
jgi:hypothetical protein